MLFSSYLLYFIDQRLSPGLWGSAPQPSGQLLGSQILHLWNSLHLSLEVVGGARASRTRSGAKLLQAVPVQHQEPSCLCKRG